MKTFSKFLAEDVTIDSSDKISNIIKKYLAKKLSTHVTKMPGIEEFKNSLGKGFGIRYFFDHVKSVRFNWKTSKLNSMQLHSVDYWDGTKHDPSFHLEFQGYVSLVKMLPTIVDFLADPTTGTYDAIPTDNLTEELILEMAMHSVFDGVVAEFKKGDIVPVTKIFNAIGSRGYTLLNQIRADFPTMFDKQGRSVVFTGDVEDIKKAKDTIIAKCGGVKVVVTPGGTKDTYAATGQVAKIEDDGIEKVAYKQQLIDLKGLIKLVVKGASNALFCAGRGGTGKTFSIEKTLNDMGLTDGKGYFKVTGSASPVGVYKLLYKNRDSIILFDDSDGALADQDARNIFKAATDTRKVRKLVWSKDSKGMVDPENMPPDTVDANGNAVESDAIPKYFLFTGKIIFISNLQIDKLDPDGALRTRALMVAINPTDAELIDQMEAIIDVIELEDGLDLDHDERMEVMAEIRASSRKADISLRKLSRGLNMRAALGTGSDWKRLVKLYA